MPRTVVIDACCLLNLVAMRRELEILHGLALQLLETPQVRDEGLIIWGPPDSDDQRGKEVTTAEPLRKAGRLVTRALDTEQLVDAFVTATARIQDADASCIALAGTLSLPLLTDDRKERRVAKDLFPGIELVSTLDILADAGEALRWKRSELKLVATDLRWRGNFAPPRNDPRSAWYDSLLREER